MLNHRNISHRVNKLGLKQSQIAKYCGVSSSAVSKWTKDECMPNAENLKKLGELLGLDESKLIIKELE